MRKILFFLLFGVVLSGCIRDNPDNCSADLRLVFTFENNLTRFDELIRNDIHLDVYCEDVYHSTISIPYHKISNGQEYRIKKSIMGNIDFVAWSVPHDDDDVQRIPLCSEGELASKKSFFMDLNDDMSCRSMGGLYMGLRNYQEEDLLSDSLCVIGLRDLICRVTVTVFGFDDSSGEQSAIPDAVELSGFKQGMTLLKDPDGDDGNIYSELAYFVEDRSLRSDILGLMPSGEEQFLQVTVFSDGNPLLKVSTEERSIPGDTIEIIITKNTGVELYVNGWRKKGATIEWM